jgi:hypothetical protein
MPTPAQIDEQIQLERDQIRLGLQKLRDNTRKLEDQSYASATVYGAASIEALLPKLVTQIESTVEYAIKRGKTGVAFKEIHQYLTDLDAKAAGAIALKVTFDKVFSTKKGSDQVTTVCEAVGLSLIHI